MVKKLKWNLVLMSALYLGLGVFLLMKPTTALNIVCYALGAVVLACAAVLHYKKETVAELKEDIRAGGVEVRRV